MTTRRETPQPRRDAENEAFRIRLIRRNLLRWYRAGARDLPWRRTRDPFRIWLSEVLLQQTRVATVTPYYRRFTAAFPDVEALARAPVSRVMKLWEGLGYYRRAAHLHEAARFVVRERGGELPRTAAEWRLLPGVGEYTAAAVASIAHGERVPALDGNARRVFARLFAVAGHAQQAAFRTETARRAEVLVPPGDPGTFNQAVMELGARVCLPRNPRCDECPVRGGCAAREEGRVEAYPERPPKKGSPRVELASGAVSRRDGRYLLVRRAPGGMLADLWEFPGGPVRGRRSHASVLRRSLREQLGIEVRVGEHLASVEHVYSHLTATFHLYRCELATPGDEDRPGGARARRNATRLPARITPREDSPWSDARWVEPGRFGRYAIHVAARKAIAFL